MTKQQRITDYNNLHTGYGITDIMKMTTEQIESRIIYGSRSLDDLYKNCSYAKRKSYADILETYKPNAILGLSGSNQAYSVLLVAGNGDKLLITRCNNYLVEEA